jgi:hypothetical protein
MSTVMPPAGTKMTRIKALAEYFNSGERKVGLKDFQGEIKALSDAEKTELAQGACDVMGWVLA